MAALIRAIVAATIAAAYIVTAQHTTKDHDKIVSCYVGTWAFYRPGIGHFDIPDIDVDLCTHGFYGFADLSNTTWEIYPFDPWYDLAPEDCDEGLCKFDSYRRFVALKDKNPDFIPMISVGGWNAGSAKYSDMAADPSKRKSFIDSTVALVEKYGFEGVDLDWEYPGSREGSHPDEDKENFNILVEEFSAELRPRGLLFSAATSPGKNTIDVAYDFTTIMDYFDFLNVMCYDYHGWFPNHTFTGLNSPMYRREEELPEDHPGWYFNVFDTVKYYMKLGVNPNQMVMGMPIYGRGFVLNETEDNGLYCPAYAGIPAGPFTQQDGIWGYQEILMAFDNDTLVNLPDGKPHEWTVVTDDCADAPYTVNGPYWIGYDNPESIAKKAQFVNFLGLKGGMVWSVDTDDFRGTYSDMKYPILHKINEVFASGDTYDPENPMCVGSAPMCDMFDPTTTTEPTTSTSTTTQSTTTSDGGGGDNECSEEYETMPYPGNCHWYYLCLPSVNGFEVVPYDCGEFVFDPNTSACVDPNLPGNDLICGTF